MAGGICLSFKHAILGLLADGPLHGYELRALYQEELAPSASVNFGQVYTTLDRLQRDGWVDHAVVTQEERPDKKVYAVTDAGKHELERWLDTPTAQNLEARNETFLKLMLARRMSQVDACEVLRVEKRACFARLHELTGARAHARAENKSPQSIMLLDLAVLRLEAFVKWLENCDDLLREDGRS